MFYFHAIHAYLIFLYPSLYLQLFFSLLCCPHRHHEWR